MRAARSPIRRPSRVRQPSPSTVTRHARPVSEHSPRYVMTRPSERQYVRQCEESACARLKGCTSKLYVGAPKTSIARVRDCVSRYDPTDSESTTHAGVAATADWTSARTMSAGALMGDTICWNG